MAACKKIAHRGASGNYPESTRLALQKAIAAGADMIELDCQMTQDGHVVIFHDDKLRRTAGGRGALRDQTLAQLQKLDIGRWRGKKFAGERILTLEEALEVMGGKIDLCLEFKTFGAAAPGMDLKVLFTLSHYDYLERTVLSSFDYRCLARLRDHAPEAALGIIYGAGVDDDPFEAARRVGAASLHVQKEIATREFLRQAWDEGLDVYVWTVNEAREIETFAGLGVQGLISDFPEKLARL
ncbi:MAG: glycerophosphodiester phosphodiesterase [Deltaproteobacteria bacterium]|nr:glycerophosphodiester phosphodiesterase [Deltaproteobacteria bacterium]